jgi:hypothetical protein
MRRVRALTLFTLGYFVMAAFDADIAAVPSLAAFFAGAYSLAQPLLAAN